MGRGGARPEEGGGREGEGGGGREEGEREKGI